MSDQLQARVQRMEKHLASLDQRVSVLAAVNGDAAKKRIADTFGSDPRMAIIYRGVQRGMTQQAIADALRERNLPKAMQQKVSLAFHELEDLEFIEKTPQGQWVPIEGWKSFGLEKVLKKTLRDRHIDDLP